MVSIAGAVFYAGVFIFLIVAGIIGCGNPYDSNLLGRASYFLQVTLSKTVMSAMKSIGLAWVVPRLCDVMRCCCLQRNPIVQIGYCFITFGGFGAFLWYGYPRLPNLYMAEWHKWIGIVVMTSCVATFYLASFTDPGLIKPESQPSAVTSSTSKSAGLSPRSGKGVSLRRRAAGKGGAGKALAGNASESEQQPGKAEWRFPKAEWRTLPFDGALYEGPRICRTCGMVKPPRSKHCNMMGGCVARYDHYCVWLNSAVGERNYRWFILYLVCHTIMLLYGAVACACIFASEITENQMLTRKFVNVRTGEEILPSYSVLFQYLMSQHPELMLIQILCAVMGFVLVLFTGYHLSLVASNVTTNETFKYNSFHTDRNRKRMIQSYARHRRHTAGLPPDGAAGSGTGHVAATGGADDTEDEVAVVKGVTNRYDRGVWLNFAEAFFPLSERSEADWPRLAYDVPPPMDMETVLLQGGSTDEASVLLEEDVRKASGQ